MRDGALLSWRWLNTCLPMGSSEHIPHFALLACVALAFHIKLSLSQPTSFLTFTLLIRSPIPPGRKGASCRVVLTCQLGLNHNSILRDVEDYEEECNFMTAVKIVDSVYLYALQSISNWILATACNYIA